MIYPPDCKVKHILTGVLVRPSNAVSRGRKGGILDRNVMCCPAGAEPPRLAYSPTYASSAPLPVWRLAAEYFPEAEGELDFYHASEHLWALARDLFEDEESAHEWVGVLLKGLKRRGGAELLPILKELLEMAEDEWPEEEREVLKRETAYFQKHSSHLCYPKAKRQGFPLGSGAMESACPQLQGRFKRPGQFWSKSGEDNLLALELARRNGDWDELWAKRA